MGQQVLLCKMVAHIGFDSPGKQQKVMKVVPHSMAKWLTKLDVFSFSYNHSKVTEMLILNSH